MGAPTNGPLPVGTVTFLLTDVEGSTMGWEADRAAMAAAIADERRVGPRRSQILAEGVLRATLGAGVGFRSTGDLWLAGVLSTTVRTTTSWKFSGREL